MKKYINYDKVKVPIDLKSKDLKLGDKGENYTMKILRKYYPTIKQFRNFFSPFDFYVKNDNERKLDIIIEVKTRRVDFYTYDTLAFGYSKMEYAKKELEKNKDLKIFFCWLLNDKKLYGWEYNGNNDNEYTIGTIQNKFRNQKLSKCCYVNTKNIKPFEDYHNILSA